VDVGRGARVGGDGDITLVGRRARVEDGSELPAGARYPEPEDD
jgi:glucose-1-phosphate adenylyltransferase